ncbi:MAG: hypothetical protein AB7S70_05510 [Hyphomicrobium sp.]|uniref:sodium:solute symporter family transporter n=1 Tax=Hyphomicrobium sp. TaxID=82 RepID=UPI003D0D7F1F
MSDSVTAQVRGGLSAAGLAVPVSLLAALPGLVYFAGFDHLAYGLGLMAGVVLAGALVAPRLAGEGDARIVAALERRFGRGPATAAPTVLVLALIPILAAEYAFAALLAEVALSLPYGVAVAAALAGTVALAAFIGDRAMSALGTAAYVLIVAALAALLALLAAHAVSGDVFAAIGALEARLLENGLVDFDTFSLHLTPFLRLPGAGLIALVVSLAVGTAVLAPLLSALAAGRTPGEARSTAPWAALFVMLVLLAVPAVAAYAKLGIYSVIAAGTPLTDLPAWLDAPLAAGYAHIHGTSTALLAEVARALPGSGTDPAAIADALELRPMPIETRWLALDAEMRRVVVEAAQTLGPVPSPEALKHAFVGTVLPAAATAAGNEAAVLSQAALVVEPLGLLLALPALAGAPASLVVALAVAMIAATLVMATALVRSLLSVVPVPASHAPRSSWQALAVGLLSAALAAGAALLRPGDLYGMVVTSLSLAGAGLFPALAVGLAWKRATAAGVTAAIVIGAGVAFYYDVGIQAFPVSFYETWAPLSNAGEFAIENFRALQMDAVEAEDASARAGARTALETLARGTPGRPGLANWAGIDSASGAIFAVPLGLLALVVVSLVTGRRSRSVAPHP